MLWLCPYLHVLKVSLSSLISAQGQGGGARPAKERLVLERASGSLATREGLWPQSASSSFSQGLWTSPPAPSLGTLPAFL